MNGNRESVTGNQQFDYCRIWYSIAVTLHKSCYCSYTSKHIIQKHTAHKRKAESNLVEEQPSSRIRRSQVDRFDFMSQCLFCGHLCQSMNTKHPER